MSELVDVVPALKVVNNIELVYQSLSDDLELIQDPFIAESGDERTVKQQKGGSRGHSHAARRQRTESGSYARHAAVNDSTRPKHWRFGSRAAPTSSKGSGRRQEGCKWIDHEEAQVSQVDRRYGRLQSSSSSNSMDSERLARTDDHKGFNDVGTRDRGACGSLVIHERSRDKISSRPAGFAYLVSTPQRKPRD